MQAQRLGSYVTRRGLHRSRSSSDTAGGADDDLVDVDAVGLIDGVGDRAANGPAGDAHRAVGAHVLGGDGVGDGVGELRLHDPGEMVVTLILSPISWRSPSVMAQAAYLVAQ